MPVWQALFEELRDRNFVIVSVALDAGGADAVRAYIRPAAPIVVPAPMRAIMGWSEEQYANATTPSYPCLIDEKHVVAELYDMPNVPMAVWIDESGRIVRPAEAAGASDAFRRMDRASMTMPQEVAAQGRESRSRYVAAIRDWVAHGARSPYALSTDAARERVGVPTENDALAVASFRLGHYFREQGEGERATFWFDEAKRLSPNRWTFFRQALHLEENGKASGSEFLARVAALGDRPYYPEVTL